MAEFVVIGGGFAGLAAAVRLAGGGQRVKLLERRGFLGGRAYSFVDSATGEVVDNGQHLFMGCYHQTVDFLRKIGAIEKLKFQATPRVDFLEEGERRASFKCPFVPAPWHLLLGLWRMRTLGPGDKLHALAVGKALRQLENGAVSGLNDTSVAEWLSQLGQTARIQRNFWNPIAIATLNQDPQRASADLFVRVLQQAFLSDRASSAIGISTVGLSDLYTREAEQFIRQRGGDLRFNTPASRIITVEGRAIGVELKGDEIISADAVIAAVPPIALAQLLPMAVSDAEPGFRNLWRLGASPIVSINLWFDRPITDIKFAGLLGTHVQWLFNKNTISMSPSRERAHLALVISAAAEYVAKPKEELINLALEECWRMLPASERAELVHAVVVKEREATISHEVGTGRYRLGPTTRLRNLYLAGDWTDTGLPATIESAVSSGNRAADLAMKGN